MWNKDWIDTLVVLSWIGAWSMLVYFVPSGAI